MTRAAFRIAVLIAAFGFAVTLVYFLCPTILSSRYPTDLELENRYSQNQQEFLLLLSLFIEDKHLRSVNRRGGVWIDFGEPANIDAERLQRYNNLFDQLGVQRISRYNERSVELLVWSSTNFFIGGKYKHFVYDPEYSGKITSSLDEIYKQGIDANHYKKLDKNWYLYLDVW